MIAGIILAAAFTIGIKAYLLIQMPVMLIGGAGGVWLFYVQHQFDPSYWARTEDWESMDAAMQGSSYYKLPKVLQWISGNIGLHHVHHLRPRIPNYNLQECLNATPELQLPDPLLLWPEPEVGAAEGLGREAKAPAHPEGDVAPAAPAPRAGVKNATAYRGHPKCHGVPWPPKMPRRTVAAVTNS